MSLIWGASIIPCTLKGYVWKEKCGKLRGLQVFKSGRSCNELPQQTKKTEKSPSEGGGGGNEFYTKYQIGLIRVSTNRLVEGFTFTLRRASSNSKKRKDMLCYTFKREDVHTIIRKEPRTSFAN